MPNSSSYIRRSLFLVAVLLFSSCSSSSKPTENSVDGSVSLQFVIPAKLAQSVARVEYLVSGEGMEELKGELRIVGNVARGTIVGIEPGEERLFVLSAYDAAGGVSHMGLAMAEIVAGRVTEVRIQLLPLAGAAEVIGNFGDAPLFAKPAEEIGKCSNSI